MSEVAARGQVVQLAAAAVAVAAAGARGEVDLPPSPSPPCGRPGRVLGTCGGRWGSLLGVQGVGALGLAVLVWVLVPVPAPRRWP